MSGIEGAVHTHTRKGPSGENFVVWPLACHLSSLTDILSFVNANNYPGLHTLKKGKVILCERL